LRKIAALLVALGLTLGLLGAGISASFSDTATANQAVSVGSFGCAISSTVAGATVSNANHTVTFPPLALTSSVAGTSAMPFTVKSTGTIPVKVHVTQTTPPAPFTSTLPAPADVNLALNETHVYAGGLSWTELGNSSISAAFTMTYTATCTESGVVVGPPLPPVPTYIRTGNVVTIREHMCPTDMYGGTYTIQPGDTLSTYNMNTTGTAWSDNLATADSAGIIYYVGNGFAPPATQAAPGNLQIKIMSASTLKCTFTPNL